MPGKKDAWRKDEHIHRGVAIGGAWGPSSEMRSPNNECAFRSPSNSSNYYNFSYFDAPTSGVRGPDPPAPRRYAPALEVDNSIDSKQLINEQIGFHLTLIWM